MATSGAAEGSDEPQLQDVEEEQFAMSWSDPNWLQLYSLHHNSIYDYFQNSPFYQNQCNNNILQQQQMAMINVEEQLRNMVGTEYEVDYETRRKDMTSSPVEFTSYNVIFEKFRESPNKTELKRIYYTPGVQNHPQYGSIFPMPSINMVFNNKMRSAVHHLNEAMEALQSNKYEDIIKSRYAQKGRTKKKRKKEKESKTNQAKRNQYSSLVQGLIMETQRAAV